MHPKIKITEKKIAIFIFKGRDGSYGPPGPVGQKGDRGLEGLKGLDGRAGKLFCKSVKLNKHFWTMQKGTSLGYCSMLMLIYFENILVEI